MPSEEEIGFAEVRGLVRDHWKLIVGLGVLFGLLTLAAVLFLLPEVYVGTATLVVHPSAAESYDQPIAVYYSLLTSETILERASKRLVEEGILPTDGFLRLGEHVVVAVVANRPPDGQPGSSILTITGRSRSSEGAATIANTMADVFVQECRSMISSTAADSEKVLNEQLSPTLLRLGELEGQRSELLDGFQAREEETSTSWDRRVSAAEKAGRSKIAAYQGETRRQMEEVVSSASVSPAVRSKLLEIVGVRAQLAQAPRVLSLEKAASDETLAELIVQAKDAELFDSTLVTQEINPLYDQLSMRVLALESELEGLAGSDGPGLSAVLTALEGIQLERGAGLAALVSEGSLDVRILRRRRSRALEDLTRERTREVGALDREIDRFGGLETKLSDGLNKALMSRLLEDVEVVRVAARAVPQGLTEPRDLPLKVAAAGFLGAMLGLMIALFRSVNSGVRERSS